MRALKAAVLAIIASVSAPFSVGAASIAIEAPPEGEPLTRVYVDGPLLIEDGDEFRAKTASLSKAVVLLRSEGGSVLAGIQIGESIRLKGFYTLVLTHCESACALAWLGGSRRFMAAKARIGFHAAYNSQSGRETGVGNALVGAYLNRIGLPYEAVAYVTAASPNEMTWLDVQEAKALGIDAIIVDEGERATPTQTQTPQQIASELINRTMVSWSAPNAEALTALQSLYDVDVMYYGKHISREAAIEDQRRFFERWPLRSYKVRTGTLAVECFEPTRPVPYPFCNASGIIDWDASNAAQRSTGVANFAYSIVIRDGRPTIWSQESKVVQRRLNQSGKPPLPNTK